ncbi:MAG TPA: L,D-transpeptidase [Actinoplanes sp.]|nr:L,D-transpeptidase [Actinoplanes sp.]
MSWLPNAGRVSVAGLLLLALVVPSAVARRDRDGVLAERRVLPPPSPVVAVVEPAPTAGPAPAELPKIDYWGTPPGFPPDPDPHSVAVVAEGLRPHGKIAVYDAPGGQARAFLARSISGLPVTVPIVERRPGWLAVLLPSINRHVGWVPDTAGDVRPLPDRLILDRSERRLTWFRDGQERGDWAVAVGAPATPTPLGRTYVMGRTITSGPVYAGLDALVLGAIPDDRDALSAALRDGHTAIHAWRDESAFGRDISNGCIRMPVKVQRTLLDSLQPGTVVHVVA